MKKDDRLDKLQIDFVIPYVNGNDPIWAEKRNSFLNQKTSIDARERRYRDWNLLKYWFRGVEKFAPWVNKIFLITDHQIPEWIDNQHNKLVLINHEDYIPNEFLPVFSANPIELNLHRISGLSEYFVFFNDDIFLTDYVSENDFFRNRLPCDYAVETPIGVSDRMFGHIVLNDILYLNRHYSRKGYLRRNLDKHYSVKYIRGAIKNLFFSLYRREKFFGFLYEHIASSYLKSTLSSVWTEDTDGWLSETCTHRFRTDNDVNQYVFRQYQYVNGIYYPYNWRKNSRSFQLRDGNNGNIVAAQKAIKLGKYKQINLNDANVTDFEKSAKQLAGAFEQLLPNPCSFEK